MAGPSAKTAPAARKAAATAPAAGATENTRAAAAGLHGPWGMDQAVVVEKRLTFGRQYHIEAPPGSRVGYCKQKVFRLREDIRVWTGEEQKEELWRLRTHKVLDFNAAFQLVDGKGRVVASFRRKGWKSIFKPEWLLFDDQGRQRGVFTVDSGWMVFLRRYLPLGDLLLPTTYHLRIDGADGPAEVARVVERRRFWGNTLQVQRVPGSTMDLRIPVAMAVLSAIFAEERNT